MIRLFSLHWPIFNYLSGQAFLTSVTCNDIGVLAGFSQFLLHLQMIILPLTWAMWTAWNWLQLLDHLHVPGDFSDAKAIQRQWFVKVSYGLCSAFGWLRRSESMQWCTYRETRGGGRGKTTTTILQCIKLLSHIISALWKMYISGLVVLKGWVLAAALSSFSGIFLTKLGIDSSSLWRNAKVSGFYPAAFFSPFFFYKLSIVSKCHINILLFIIYLWCWR